MNMVSSHTAHQLFGITQLVPPFCFSEGENLSHYKAHDDKKDLSRPTDKLYGRPSLLSSSGQLSFSRVLISPIALKAVWWICIEHIQLWAVSVCKLPFETNVAIMSTNIQKLLNYLIIELVIENIFSRFQGLVFLSRK